MLLFVIKTLCCLHLKLSKPKVKLVCPGLKVRSKKISDRVRILRSKDRSCQGEILSGKGKMLSLHVRITSFSIRPFVTANDEKQNWPFSFRCESYQHDERHLVEIQLKFPKLETAYGMPDC